VPKSIAHPGGFSIEPNIPGELRIAERSERLDCDVNSKHMKNPAPHSLSQGSRPPRSAGEIKRKIELIAAPPVAVGIALAEDVDLGAGRCPQHGHQRQRGRRVWPANGFLVTQQQRVFVRHDTLRPKEQFSRAQHEWRARVSGIVYPLAVIVGVLALWEIGTRLFAVPAFLLPAPSAIAASFVANFFLLLSHGWITTLEILLGFGLSIGVGIPLALAIFLSPVFSRSILPLLVSSQAMPKVAVAPLFLVWFGFGLLPKVLIAFLIAFFPVVINTAVGLASIEPEKIHLARSMGFGATATFFKIRLPNALPAIFGGLKISITLAVVGAVVGEFVGGDAGLGYLLMVANGSMDTQLLFAGIIALTILGVALFLLVELAERLAIPRHILAGDKSAREGT